MCQTVATHARIYYGWVVVGVCFVSIFSEFGTSYSFSVFFEKMLHAFELPQGIMSLVFSLQPCSLFGTAALIGPLVRRVGVWTLLAVGTGLFAVGLWDCTERIDHCPAGELWHRDRRRHGNPVYHWLRDFPPGVRPSPRADDWHRDYRSRIRHGCCPAGRDLPDRTVGLAGRLLRSPRVPPR